MTSDQIPKEGYASQNRKHPAPDPRWIKERFSYCPKTGNVYGIKGKPIKRKIQGYFTTSIISEKKNNDGTTDRSEIAIPCHRIAFALIEGRWPHLINHKDGNKLNNKWSNLEETTQKKNVKDTFKNHQYKLGKLKRGNYTTWRVSIENQKRVSFKDFHEASQFLKEMNAWREAGRQGPAPTPKRKKNK